MALPTAEHPGQKYNYDEISPATLPYAITAAMIADMLASATNIRKDMVDNVEYIPRALACETAGLVTFVVMDDGAERTVADYPLVAGTNPIGGMHRVTAFAGTNLWGVL